MDRKVKWGVLSTAKIGVEKVIPAMQRGNFSEVVAISSRDAEKARSTADRLGIPTFWKILKSQPHWKTLLRI